MTQDSETARRIAEAALRLLEEEGLVQVTMRRLAQIIGITPMAIYHYFPGREALLRAITEDEFDRIERLFDALEVRGSALSRLRKMIDAYVTYAFKKPRVFDFIFANPRPDALRFPEDFRARRSRTMNRVADAIAEAMRQGVLKKDDVWEVAFALWAHVHGHIALARGGRLGLSEAKFRALLQRSVRRFLHGLKAKRVSHRSAGRGKSRY